VGKTHNGTPLHLSGYRRVYQVDWKTEKVLYCFLAGKKLTNTGICANCILCTQ